MARTTKATLAHLTAVLAATIAQPLELSSYNPDGRSRYRVHKTDERGGEDTRVLGSNWYDARTMEAVLRAALHGAEAMAPDLASKRQHAYMDREHR